MKLRNLIAFPAAKSIVITASLFLYSHTPLFSQKQSLFPACRIVSVSPNQAKVLNSNEDSIIAKASDKPYLIVCYDNPYVDISFQTRMSVAQTKDAFSDKSYYKKRLPSYFLITAVSQQLDTFYLLSCSSLKKAQQQYHLIPDSVCPQVLIPLAQYSNVLSPAKQSEANSIYRNLLATQLNGKLINDTILHSVRLTIDSNQYLPQADYRYLLNYILNSTQSKMPVYANSKLQRQLTYTELGMKMMDTIESVIPGLSDVVTTAHEKSLIINYKWIPIEYNDTLWQSQYTLPLPYCGYRCVIESMGLQMTSGNVIWFSNSDLELAMKNDGFDFSVYQECIRAELFKLLGVRLH